MVPEEGSDKLLRFLVGLKHESDQEPPRVTPSGLGTQPPAPDKHNLGNFSQQVFDLLKVIPILNHVEVEGDQRTR